MAEFILRCAEEKDKEQILRLWQASFGDGEAFVRELMETGELLKNAVCAQMDGGLRSCMFSFDGLELGGVPAAYLYALCTQPEYRSRGLGRAVTAYAGEMARARGAKLCFLRPADKGLENWYASALGARVLVRTAPERISAPGLSPEKARKIGADEYLRLRPRGDWALPRPLLLAQDCVHRHWGGAFLSVGSSLLCAEDIGGEVLIREIFTSEPQSALAAAAEFFGVKELLLLRRSPEGAPLMCLPPFSAGTAPELPPMPFTLD